jgi:hypothetical protein
MNGDDDLMNQKERKKSNTVSIKSNKRERNINRQNTIFVKDVKTDLEDELTLKWWYTLNIGSLIRLMGICTETKS